MKRIFLFLLSACMIQNAPASVLGDLAASMQPGTWAELTGMNGFTTANGDMLGNGTESIMEYCDRAAWDPVGRQFLMLGSSHYGNARRFVKYDEAANTWSTAPLPPQISHSYEHITIDPADRALYYRQYSTANIYKYDLSIGSWSSGPNMTLGYTQSCCGALVYFPEMNGLIMVLGGYGEVDYYNKATGKWTQIATNLPMGGLHNFAIYNPVHKVVVFGGGNENANLPGNQARAVYKLDSSGTVTPLKEAPLDLGVMQSINTVDPVTGTFLFFGNGNLMYCYDVTTDTWAQRAAGQAAPLILLPPYLNPQVFDITATPVSTHGVVMFAKYYSTPGKIFLYKHFSGSVIERNSPGHAGAELRIRVSPNPFTSSTRITVNHAGDNAKIRVFSVAGKQAAYFAETGQGVVVWDARKMAPGLYTVRAEIKHEVLVKKAILLP